MCLYVPVWWWWWWWWSARVGVRVGVRLTLAADPHVHEGGLVFRGRNPRLPRHPSSKELLVVVVPQAPLPLLR